MIQIKDAFAEHKAFIPFITVGDPDLETTVQLVHAAVENGADLVELGIPFSDPTAEGPVIMEADLVALNAGTTTDKVFEVTKRLRSEGITVPFVYMTYANVVYSYGYVEGSKGPENAGIERFAARAAEAGVQGIILPDVPFEEKGEFDAAFSRYGLDVVSMIAPTSEDRISMIAKEARGFIYVVSSLGVTGTRSNITTDISAMTALVRKVTDVPCAVGFGISNPEQAKAMAGQSDGAIVGSAIIKLIAKYGKDAAGPVGAYVRSMAEAVHQL